mgnify:CR=1 FL=1
MDALSVLRLVGDFLRQRPDFVTAEEVRALTDSGVSEEMACATLLAAACGLNPADCAQDRELLHRAFVPMTQLLSPQTYQADAYFRAIRMPDAREGAYRLGTEGYLPYEACVCGELWERPDGLLLPRIGFFREGFRYPALLENDTLWMSVTPNEVETMRGPIARAAGNVLVYGLGMGYYAFMAARKPEVQRVTVVEKSPEVIRLFEQYLLPQFPCRSKLCVVPGDAFDFAKTKAPGGGYDTVFADLWHDAGDGIPMYQALKALEPLCPGARFDYWIEPTMRLYRKAMDGFTA